jgi:hypothetical protein
LQPVNRVSTSVKIVKLRCEKIVMISISFTAVNPMGLDYSAGFVCVVFCSESIFNRFSIHLHEFFKEFSMNYVNIFLYSGIVVDFF